MAISDPTTGENVTTTKVLASASCTLVDMRDIKETHRYYLLQSSTLTEPDKPSNDDKTLPPSGGWQETEPSYKTGSTDSLYLVDLTIYSNSDYMYSPVSLSSSYEAAKVAYNKAIQAQTSADEAAKMATNYLSFSKTDGLVISEDASTTDGWNTQIKNDGLHIRNGSTVVADYGQTTKFYTSPDSDGATNEAVIIDSSGVNINKGQILLRPSDDLESWDECGLKIDSPDGDRVFLNQGYLRITSGDTATNGAYVSSSSISRYDISLSYYNKTSDSSIDQDYTYIRAGSLEIMNTTGTESATSEYKHVSTYITSSEIVTPTIRLLTDNTSGNGGATYTPAYYQLVIGCKDISNGYAWFDLRDKSGKVVNNLKITPTGIDGMTLTPKDLTDSIKGNYGSNAVNSTKPIGSYFSIVKVGKFVICSLNINLKKNSSQNLGVFYGLPKAKYPANASLGYNNYSSVVTVFIRAGQSQIFTGSTIPYDGFVEGQLIYITDE